MRGCRRPDTLGSPRILQRAFATTTWLQMESASYFHLLDQSNLPVVLAAARRFAAAGAKTKAHPAQAVTELEEVYGGIPLDWLLHLHHSGQPTTVKMSQVHKPV